MAQLVGASLSGLCRAERPGFKSYSDKHVISKRHLALHSFAPLFSLLDLREGHTLM